VNAKLLGVSVALMMLAGATAGQAGDDKDDETAKTGIPSPSIATSLPSELADPGGIRRVGTARKALTVGSAIAVGR
jgi:hypothetical protein